ncbi:uncharacterized protein LOC132755002 [Ruditapes philippinarum]|uniref:uncharacterized protein LOC132755002 n=1 Tax=Ruditapes philippinarum TaxID=129788 RepID=UPI00295C27A1|nr:uncharacterized protein LOC132755002 [Ruditapes philippinarum]
MNAHHRSLCPKKFTVQRTISNMSTDVISDKAAESDTMTNSFHINSRKGIIEEVKPNKSNGTVHYLAHHGVITPQKTTTKLRVVYDASAKTSKENNCLNDCLYRGPVMVHDLCGILLRFRKHPIAIVADIERAFLQIELQRDQRDVTRFLWLKDIDNPMTNACNIQEFRFCRVPFGVVSSPFLLGATIEHHLDTFHNEISNK